MKLVTFSKNFALYIKQVLWFETLKSVDRLKHNGLKEKYDKRHLSFAFFNFFFHYLQQIYELNMSHVLLQERV